jgi:glutathione S-transferase
MEAMLQKSQWMAGESYSLADIATYCVVPGLPRLAPDLMNETITPRMVQWLRAMNARPAVKAALAMPNKVPETLEALGIKPMPRSPPSSPVLQ